MAMTVDNAVDEIILRGSTGACYFLEVESIVRAHGPPTASRADARPEVLATIRRLLEERLFVAGGFHTITKDGRPFAEFTPWTGNVEAQLERINTEATTLADNLNIGDVVWLEITPIGLVRAKALRSH